MPETKDVQHDSNLKLQWAHGRRKGLNAASAVNNKDKDKDKAKAKAVQSRNLRLCFFTCAHWAASTRKSCAYACTDFTALSRCAGVMALCTCEKPSQPSFSRACA